MNHEVSCEWKGGMKFEASVMGFTIMMDSAHGNEDAVEGPLPKPLVLVAAAGCTGMDVVPMLKKMQVPIERFDMKVTGEVADSHPKVYKKINILFEFFGEHLEAHRSQIERAVELSQQKYCSVSAMLRPNVEISTAIKIHESATMLEEYLGLLN